MMHSYTKTHNLVKDVQLLEDKLDDYVACQYVKQVRRLFSQMTWKERYRLQLVSTDVGGPQKTPSLNGVAKDGLKRQPSRLIQQGHER